MRELWLDCMWTQGPANKYISLRDRRSRSSTVNMAPGRYGPWSIWPTLSLYGPSRWSIWPTPCQYDPPLVDIAKTVIARLCYINYNIAIIVRKLEGWLEGPKCVPHPPTPRPSGNEPRTHCFQIEETYYNRANNNLMSFSSLHRNTQGKTTVRTS